MRYPPDHKERAREKILDAAAALFRRHGYDAVGIDRLMAEAGLTRGGFYAHFRSKQHLFAEVMRRDGDFNRRMRDRPEGQPEELLAGALEIVDGYLGPMNLTAVARGCQMAALSLDTARSGPEARRAYDDKLQDLRRAFERSMPNPVHADARALAVIAQCVGAVTIANACENTDLKEDVLAAARRSAEKILRCGAPNDGSLGAC